MYSKVSKFSACVTWSVKVQRDQMQKSQLNIWNNFRVNLKKKAENVCNAGRKPVDILLFRLPL